MKASSICYLIVILFSVTIVRSQSLDSALTYYPLSVGDQWEYGYKDVIRQSYQYYFTVTIEGDTLLPNGKIYKKKVQRQIPNGPVQYFFERIDSASGHIYASNPNSSNEWLVVNLRANLGDSVGNYGWLRSITSSTVFGDSTLVKTYKGLVGSNAYWLAYGFGLIFVSELLADEWPYNTDIQYAKINGREYGTLLSVDKPNPRYPEIFQLQQNYPNPFNPTTCITFSLPKREFALLQVFDVLGRETTKLIDCVTEAGLHSITFDGSRLSSGVYIIRIIAGENVSTKSMLLLK